MKCILLAWLTAFGLVLHALDGRAADVDKLISDVGSKDVATSVAAIDKLAELGAEAQRAVKALAGALKHPAAEVRWHAARTLGAIGPGAREAVGPLLSALDDQDAKVRAYAAFALGEIRDGASAVVDKLINRAFDQDHLVRRASLRALRKIDPPEEKVLPVVLKILEEGDPNVIMPAMYTLAEEGAEAVPRLCRALKHEKACYWACVVLGEIGPAAEAAVPHLRPLLSHKDPEVRLQALVTLGEIGQAARSLRPQIVAALRNDPFDGVRYAAAYALGKIGLDDEATQALQASAEDDDPFLQMISVWALARNKPGDRSLVERAIKLMVNAFRSDNVHLRRLAARAAVDFDVPPEVTAPLLVQALRDADPTVVGNAIAALAEMGPKALDHIDNALNNKELRHYAIRLIYRMGPKAAKAVPALIEVLNEQPQSEEDVLFMRDVQFALAAIGPAAQAAVPTLVRSLSSDKEEIQASAIYALGRIGPAARAAVPALRQNLRSNNFIVRLASVRALLQIQPGQRRLAEAAVPLLLKALDDERELVRAEAATALGEIGAPARRAVPRLKKLKSDNSELVRKAADEALKKLQG